MSNKEACIAAKKRRKQEFKKQRTEQIDIKFKGKQMNEQRDKRSSEAQ
jgi:hypothetical protein